MSFSQFIGFDIGYMITVCEIKVKMFLPCTVDVSLLKIGPLTKTGFVKKKDQPLPPYIIAAFCISVDLI